MNRLVKGLWIALAASLALNVFLVGFAVARYWKHSAEWRGAESSEMDRPAMRAMRRQWMERAKAFKGRREAVEAARVKVKDALVAEPFSADALANALASLRQETTGTQVALDEAFVDFARGLSPEDRRKLAESRWFPGRGGRGARH